MRAFSSFIPSERRDPLILLAIWALLLAVSPIIGIWEPWEADQASIIETMRANGSWMQVRFPTAEGSRLVAELPFGYWPSILTTAIFGYDTLGLRLPSLLFALPVLLLVALIGRRVAGRLGSWISVLSLLAMPLFAYHSRLALGQGLGMEFEAISALSFMALLTEESSAQSTKYTKLFIWTAWISLAFSTLISGIPGLLPPLALAIVGSIYKPETFNKLFPKLPMIVAIFLISLGFWRVLVHFPQDASSVALFFWQDVLEATPLAKNRPTFELITHQIGFGLFPFGALLPLALAMGLWHNEDLQVAKTTGEIPSNKEAHENATFYPAMTAWIALAFLLPAITFSFSHRAIFLAAPAVALVVGVYLTRIVSNGQNAWANPAPILALAAVVFVALIDSNLKHDTHLLADTFIGSKVQEFPDSLSGFWIARLLDFALLGAIILYQARADRMLPAIVKWLFYPTRKTRIAYSALLLILSLIAPIYISIRPPRMVENILNHALMAKLMPSVRTTIVFLVVFLFTFALFETLLALRIRALDGRREGRWTKDINAVVTYLLRPNVALVVGFGICACFALFQNGLVASTLTTNFSQEKIIERYRSLSENNEPLYTYAITEQDSSFYAKKYEAIQPRDFTNKMNTEGRIFALIPRNRLAETHNNFRHATGRNLPVLYDENFRYLLISNQIKTGEKDLNPINRALIKELPSNANTADVLFDDQIALEGWTLSPKEPRPGSTLTVTLYWRALKEIRANWKVFVHIDAAGQRIHGDHDPVEGLFTTQNWSKGDLIRDEYQIKVPGNITPARFTFYAGLFKGGTRMKITRGEKDSENRARLGTLRVH